MNDSDQSFLENMLEHFNPEHGLTNEEQDEIFKNSLSSPDYRMKLYAVIHESLKDDSFSWCELLGKYRIGKFTEENDARAFVSRFFLSYFREQSNA